MVRRSLLSKALDDDVFSRLQFTNKRTKKLSLTMSHNFQNLILRTKASMLYSGLLNRVNSCFRNNGPIMFVDNLSNADSNILDVTTSAGNQLRCVVSKNLTLQLQKCLTK